MSTVVKRARPQEQRHVIPVPDNIQRLAVSRCVTTPGCDGNNAACSVTEVHNTCLERQSKTTTKATGEKQTSDGSMQLVRCNPRLRKHWGAILIEWTMGFTTDFKAEMLTVAEC